VIVIASQWNQSDNLKLRDLVERGYTVTQLARSLRRSPETIIKRANSLRLTIRKAGKGAHGQWLEYQVRGLGRRVSSLRAIALDARSKEAALSIAGRVESCRRLLRNLRAFMDTHKERCGESLLRLEKRLLLIRDSLQELERRLSKRKKPWWKISLKTLKLALDILNGLLVIVVAILKLFGLSHIPL
jgi:hypothetical protein